MKITYQQVEQNIASIANRSVYTVDFLYELLAAYGRAAAAITQLKAGTLNKATDPNAILQKDVVYFKVFPKDTILEHEIETIENDPLTGRYRPRYLIATDLTELRAKDTKKNTTLAIKIADLDKDIAFFYGWTGDEMTDNKTEAVADRRAADKMNELYSEIEKVNLAKFTKEGSAFRHDLNVFFSRLLFCFFAEDTGLFAKNQFSNAIKLITNTDGSDLNIFFVNLFKALDSEDKSAFSTPYSEFPFVNGTIFNTAKHSIAVPDFNAQARHLLLECTKSNWGEIHPDIFGTMFQGIVDPEKRDHNGMDYTSVPNIMKVIEPLFLDELHERFDEIYNTPSELRNLLVRIRYIKVFDPACGSGNFLIIAYKQLRLLESAIISRLDELKRVRKSNKIKQTHDALFVLENNETATVVHDSEIPLNNFYGIEIDDFAHEMAILSLYIAKHQMDAEFEKQFAVKLQHLPLIKNENIVKCNAAQIDWQTVCANNGADEIYLIGNPPYKGSRKQDENQKDDIFSVCGKMENYKSLDYISIWFLKASDYIRGTNAKYCFVSTNSITQGEQVGILWPSVLAELEIGFAYLSFKWQNSARDNAGVTVVIISLQNPSKQQKYLYSNGVRNSVDNINAYLSTSASVIVRRSSKAISQGVPKIDYGSFALDGGYLTLSEQEKDEIIHSDSNAEKFIKQFFGSQELIRGTKKYCIWIEDKDLDEAQKISLIKQRVENVQHWRSGRKGKDSQKNATTPWRFAWNNYKKANAILFPIVSSERREYVPIGYLDENTVISNAALAIYDAELWLFALLESKMHMVWIRTVCGQLETRIRYSSTLGYNTFPVPPLSEAQKAKLTASARAILLARDAHFEQTLAEMYDPDKMPSDLREVHNRNDIVVDQLYRVKGFANDEDRLATLFDLYEQMTAKKGKK
ncbi:MAG: hypothetical protein UY41_C0022G0007 [Candidatus Moranbacteria bacterium GW2011_GWE1_49_15]|nr:MAG: hypothetical protein UX75_C0041G0005 [Candidatus Moranbacteria bacterium GW2011_GWE2_47_10]KKW06528.1 MAG: hypothetical protein UY41_C0022G0007 [Candidatus Moranbacteria bacterium GW2011_GWE1_49_15]